uniref:Retrovirus-related Pol polyprotein from transposon TNT 1-94-like beta-barrel domain-containing protein n=1 Tax=Chenopodium quinoa TaxID=63459 RepID=A0A803L7T0_CHEQI
MEDGKVRIGKFNGNDFGFWKMQIEDYLHQRDLYQPVEETKPSGMKEEDWKVLDRKALGVVRLSLSRNVSYNVKDEKTTAGLIKTLSSMHEKPLAVNKTKLKSDDVRDLILSESTRRRESGESSGEAYAFEGRGRGRQGGSASHHGSEVNCPKIKKKGKGKSQGSDEDEDASTNSVTEFKSEKLEDVHLANGERVEVMGSGDVSVKLMNGGLLELKDVMYIPKLKKSLISISKLDKVGYKVVFERESWRIVKGVLVEAHGTLNGSLYTSTNTCVGDERGCDYLKMDVVWVKNEHKGVVRGKRAKGVVFGWEHGRNVSQQRERPKACVLSWMVSSSGGSMVGVLKEQRKIPLLVMLIRGWMRPRFCFLGTKEVWVVASSIERK